MDGIRKRGRNRIGDQGALARSRNTGNDCERTELNLGGNVFEVVGAGARDLKAAAAGLAALVWHADHPLAGQISTRHGIGARHDIGRRSRGDHVPAVDARAWPHIDHIVGSANRVLIVFNDDNGVADIAQALECLNQPLVVALVKTNRRLVQNIENAHEARTDLRSQANALRLTAGKRRRSTIERQIIKADINQKTQAFQDFLDDTTADELLTLGELKVLKKLERLAARQATNLINGLAAHGDGEHLGAQASTMAARTRLLANVLLQARLSVLVGRLGIALVQDIAHARKLGVPLAATTVELLIVHRNLLVAHAIQKCTAHSRRYVFPRCIRAHLKVLTDRGEDLGVVVRIAEQASKDPIGNRLRRVLNQRLGIDRFLKAQTIALGTRTIGRVERKVAGL